MFFSSLFNYKLIALYLTNFGGVYIYMKTYKFTKQQLKIIRKALIDLDYHPESLDEDSYNDFILDYGKHYHKVISRILKKLL